jgi:hypothetical protein
MNNVAPLISHQLDRHERPVPRYCAIDGARFRPDWCGDVVHTNIVCRTAIARVPR